MLKLYEVTDKVTEKEKSLSVCLAIFLLGYPDSNQERQDQNLQCYHYTIPQFRCKEKPFSRLRVQR